MALGRKKVRERRIISGKSKNGCMGERSIKKEERGEGERREEERKCGSVVILM